MHSSSPWDARRVGNCGTLVHSQANFCFLQNAHRSHVCPSVVVVGGCATLLHPAQPFETSRQQRTMDVSVPWGAWTFLNRTTIRSPDEPWIVQLFSTRGGAGRFGIVYRRRGCGNAWGHGQGMISLWQICNLERCVSRARARSLAAHSPRSSKGNAFSLHRCSHIIVLILLGALRVVFVPLCHVHVQCDLFSCFHILFSVGKKTKVVNIEPGVCVGKSYTCLSVWVD